MFELKSCIQLIENCNNKEDILQTIKLISMKYQKNLDILYRRNFGIFYTGIDLAEDIVFKLISYTEKSNKNITNLKLLEPCVGIGSFVFAYLKAISTMCFNSFQINQIINNIYVCDIDNTALIIFKSLFSKFVKIYFDQSLDEDYWNKHLKNKLSFNLSAVDTSYVSFAEAFNGLSEKFDIVITNPPYKNLKANQNSYTNEIDFNKDKKIYSQISEYVKNNFKYANEGVLNLYRIFIEDILCNYTKDDAIVSLLVPNTILTDKSCNKLRGLILNHNKLISILEINENDKNIDAQQSMVSLLIKKGEQTSVIHTEKYNNLGSQQIPYPEIRNLSISNALYAFSNDEIKKLNTICNHPKIKNINYIINKRGELDLTINKNFISDKKTSLCLLRGRNICSYSLKNLNNLEYVTLDFLNQCNKKHFVENERIVCQQVSNINCDKRLKFAYINKGYILANSCNFISVKENRYGLDLYALLGIMNSNLLNWYFKLISSNNHINNYELDELPIPLYSNKLTWISTKVKEYLITKNTQILTDIEHLVNEAYGIIEQPTTSSETSIKIKYDLHHIIPKLDDFNLKNIAELRDDLSNNSINLKKFYQQVVEYLYEKYNKLSKNEVLNHTTFKLSDLDMEMITNIPQGGNWKNIPNDIIQKSERLKKIQKSGGRTTLYGRLDYNRPSFTITTYFNRPGNGCYIHPIHDRVITVREAARLQGFCDDYYFVGNKSDILNQVGNAVPPLLAFQIATQIKRKIPIKTCIDLFCGAGGLSQGFKYAGYKTILGVDLDKSACLTYKINNPEIYTICGDLTNIEIKNNIINIAKREKVDLICGGPPCQGFSLAGKRFIDDPRNKLFKEYVYIVENVKPKVFVFENVEGLLTFRKGAVYKEILYLFSKIGYNISAKMLKASDFAIPQKRKRIIIIGIRKDINIKPETCYPEIIPMDEKNNSTKNAIYDLEKIECSENAQYNNEQTSLYVKMLKKEISFENFISEMKKRCIYNQNQQLSLFAA